MHEGNGYKVPLVRDAFPDEIEVRQKLAHFIRDPNRLSMGHQCQVFEQRLAHWLGRTDAVLFNSGSSANLAMLQAALNLGWLRAGDCVAFSALTWATNVMPIIQLGLVPVPVDVEIDTLNASPATLFARARSMDLKAFFITNALGFTGDLWAIQKLCEERGIMLLEDNCEALGTTLALPPTKQGQETKKAGAFGVMSSHSFYVAHQLSTIEGGAVAVDNVTFADMLRRVRAHGWDRDVDPARRREGDFIFWDLGYNLRPTEITGFLGNAQLDSLGDWAKARNANWTRLRGVIQSNPELTDIHPANEHTIPAVFALPIVCAVHKREKYLMRCKAAGVETRPLIAGNITEQPFWKRWVRSEYHLSGTEVLHERGFYCACRPDMNENELAAIESCLQAD
jgi:CDP-4-dehydro-6-deoxyglucose reductase, E1